MELRDCDPKHLDDLSFVRETLLATAEEIGATVLGDTFHQFSPQGVTGIIAIAESHLSIHTWPEYRYAAVDIFTCCESFEPTSAAQLLIDRFQSKDPEIIKVERGRLPALMEPVSTP